MQITPFLGETVISSGAVVIRINPKDRERADDLVLSTSTITTVKDDRTYAAAREAVGQLKGLLNEIADSEKGAKRHFQLVTNTIGKVAKDIGQPVAQEHARILALCSGYVAQLEAQEAARREAQRKARAEAEAKIREAQQQAAMAKNEAERAKNQLLVAQAQLRSEHLKLQAQEEEAQRKALVPGGRVNHPWRFKLVDPAQALMSGGRRLLRIEVDHLACVDAVKAQLAANPDQEPVLPGIEITRETKLVVPATAQTL